MTASQKVSDGKGKQYAALPWRHTGAGVEIMLISSRGTKRWVIPKGWPIPGRSPPQAAAREAYEEAGIGGVVSPKPIGAFEYDKRLDDGKLRRCQVSVYGLEQMVQHSTWPEQGQRILQWFPLPEAADAVQEPGLAKIIRKLK